MPRKVRTMGLTRTAIILAGMTPLALSAGCASVPTGTVLLDTPTELNKVTLPTYRIEPPDVLQIESTRNVRRPDDLLRPGDDLIIEAANSLPLETDIDPDLYPAEYRAAIDREATFKFINGPYRIGPDGTVDLGPYYGKVALAELTLAQARDAVDAHLVDGTGLRDPLVTVNYGSVNVEQLVTGEHLVRPDGTVDLGTFGQVNVAGLTLEQAEQVVATAMSAFVVEPEVEIDVLAFNSKSFYVITDGGGFGEQVVKLPIVGNETVLDAISETQGLSQVSSKNIWVARPAPAGTGVAQILPVHWEEIAQEGITDTNYQLFPGDRVYVKADRLIKLDNFLVKVTAPIERVFGVIILGDDAVESLQFVQTGAGLGG
ncbi:MAG: polysaccharide biosynthesis/export family protein, partial [Planctomycetota bacterium]